MSRLLMWIFPLMLVLGTGNTLLSASPVQSEQGFVDASTHDFDAAGALELAGAWWFWNGEFVEPRDLVRGGPPAGAKAVSVPGAFSARGGFFRGTGTGFGTLALSVHLPSDSGRLEVGLAGINVAHRIGVFQRGDVIWADGDSLVGSTAEQERANQNKIILDVGSLEGVVTVWIHFSNHGHARGGAFEPPSIGVDGSLERSLRRTRFNSVLLFSVLLMMALYHFMLFVVRRADKPNLWLALTCFLGALHQATVGEDLLSLVSSAPVGYSVSVHLEYLALVLGPACAFSYVAAITRLAQLVRLERYVWGLSVLFCLGTLFTSPVVFTGWLVLEQLCLLVMSLILLYWCVRESLGGQREARLVVAGFTMVAVAGIHDVIIANLNLPTPFLVSYSFVGFALIQSWALAKKSAEAHAIADRLSLNLQEEVNIRTSELVKQKEVAETALDSAQKALRQLSRAQRELVQAEKISALGSLVGGVAHELNNPLNFVRGNQVLIRENARALEKALLGMLPDNETGDELRVLFMGRFNNIYEGLMGQHEGVERAASIVEALRGFATDQVGEKTVHDIHTVLRPALELSRDTLKGLAFSTDLPVVMPIQCNPAEICQLVMQLLNNAAYAARLKDGTPTVRLEVERVEETIRLRVIDNGPGIDPQIVNRIFDPFVTTKPVGTGTGMGLAMAARVVLDHHGTIDGQNTNAGTVFTVSLPTPKAEDQPEAILRHA